MKNLSPFVTNPDRFTPRAAPGRTGPPGAGGPPGPGARPGLPGGAREETVTGSGSSSAARSATAATSRPASPPTSLTPTGARAPARI